MKINTKLSERIANKYSDMFRIKGCYENVFQMISRCLPELTPRDEVRVLYCYAYNGMYSFYFRHAFCVLNDEIIEPLPNIREKVAADRTIPICELTIEEYSNLLLRDKRYDLFPSLLSQEVRAINKNKELAAALNPVDMSEIVGRLADNAGEFALIFQSILDGKGISPALQSTKS